MVEVLRNAHFAQEGSMEKKRRFSVFLNVGHILIGHGDMLFIVAFET